MNYYENTAVLVQYVHHRQNCYIVFINLDTDRLIDLLCNIYNCLVSGDRAGGRGRGRGGRGMRGSRGSSRGWRN